MAIRFSTGLRQAMLDSIGMRAAMANGVIRIYSGAQPLAADDAVAGTLLMEVTVDGLAFNHGTATNGLNFDAPVAALLAKAAGEVWRGTGLADGTAGWFRMSANPLDSGGSSTTLARVDGIAAKTGGDLVLSNSSIVTSQPNTVDAFQFAMNQT